MLGICSSATCVCKNLVFALVVIRFVFEKKRGTQQVYCESSVQIGHILFANPVSQD